jgi:hypothetical protein
VRTEAAPSRRGSSTTAVVAGGDQRGHAPLELGDLPLERGGLGVEAVVHHPVRVGHVLLLGPRELRRLLSSLGAPGLELLDHAGNATLDHLRDERLLGEHAGQPAQAELHRPHELGLPGDPLLE